MSIEDVKRRQEKIAEQTDKNSESIAALTAIQEVQTKNVEILQKDIKILVRDMGNSNKELREAILSSNKVLRAESSIRWRILVGGFVSLFIAMVGVIIKLAIFN